MANEPEQLAGGLGGIRDTRMLERAFKQRWPIKPEYRQAVVARMVSIVADRSTSERAAASAAKVLLYAERQNQADEHKALPDIHQHEHGVSGSVVVGVVNELWKDPAYVEYQRSRAIAADSGPVCEVGEPRPVENGTASGVYRPGTNGHANGNGHHKAEPGD